MASPTVAPEVTTPKASVPPSATTPKASVPATPTTLTAEQTNSIMADIYAAAQPNPLNATYQTTYHFRLFLAADSDMITQTNNPSTVYDLHRGIDNVMQVTLAESGVTGFNIKDVHFKQTAAQNNTTLGHAAFQGEMTITEPNGLSFLEAIKDSATQLKIANYTKTMWYLELKFLGYDETGQFTGNISGGLSNGGRWIWALTPGFIEVKVNEGGGVYTIKFTANNNSYLLDDYDILRVPVPLSVQGDTISTLFVDYITKLNAAWKTKYNGVLVEFMPIVTQKVGNYFSNPPSAAAKDPATFQMKDVETEKNPQRKWALNSVSGLYTVNVPSGGTILDFITDAIHHTVEGQNLAKDNDQVRTQPDQSTTATNSKGFKESISWSVESSIKIDHFDQTTHNYIKQITFYVTPHYTQRPVQTPTQADNGKPTAVQQAMVTAHLQNGLLNKVYEYIFTGLNTEVINFDIAFKVAWNAVLANFAGGAMRYDAFAVNAKLNKIDTNPQGNIPEDKLTVSPVACYTPPPSGGTPAATPTSPPLRLGSGNTTTPEVTVPYNNQYIEDLLSQQTAANPADYAVPVSFWQQNGDVAKHGPNSSFEGQMTRDSDVVSSLFSQRNAEGLYEGFQQINLTIRGDPYWLGQSNLHRQVLLAHGPLSVKSNNLPDFSTASPNIFLHFRFPVQVGDDFKPAMKSSSTFNGVYTVGIVDSYFADGVFKQELYATKLPLIDVTKWSGST